MGSKGVEQKLQDTEMLWELVGSSNVLLFLAVSVWMPTGLDSQTHKEIFKICNMHGLVDALCTGVKAKIAIAQHGGCSLTAGLSASREDLPRNYFGPWPGGKQKRK